MTELKSCPFCSKPVRDDLVNLAKLIRNLQCACGLSLTEAQQEPCLCTWTPVQDWFEEREIDLIREITP